MFLAALLALPSFLQARTEEPPDLETALEWLDADHAPRRELGGRWLERNLAPQHLEVVRTALARGSWELALRLRTALAAAPRGFDVAARLSVAGDARAQAVGEGALVQRLARWTDGWERALDDRGTVVGALVGEFGEVFTLEPGTDGGGLQRAASELVRHASGAPLIVVQPGLALPAVTGARFGELSGTLDTLVMQIARQHELSIAGLGFGDDLERRATRCIVLQRARDESVPTGQELVLGWVRMAVGSELRAARREAVHALASSGWPDAVAWMEERWLVDEPRERLWLDGICAAHDRGVLAPRLSDASEVERLHAYIVDPALEPEPELRPARFSAVARLLAAIGPRDARGADLRGYATLPADEDAEALTWARLVVQEGFGSIGDEPAKLLERKIETLGADARPGRAPLLLQALRTRAAVLPGRDGPELARPEALFEWSLRAGRLTWLDRALQRARVRAPARWEDPTALPRDWPFELRLEVLAWLARGPSDPGVAARHLAALMEGAKHEDLLLLARRLRRTLRAEERSMLRGALEGASHAGMRELRIALGIIDRDPHVAGARADADATQAARTAGEGPIRGLVHALALGALAADGGLLARAALIAGLDDERSTTDALHGLDWAVEALRARLDLDGERELVRALRNKARGARPAVRTRLSPDAWPAVEPPEPLDLVEFRRELPPGLR